MDTTLCFDFGNTRLKCGVFEGGKLAEVISLVDSNNSTIEDLLKRYRPIKTILSSVIDHNAETEKILAEKNIARRCFRDFDNAGILGGAHANYVCFIFAVL